MSRARASQEPTADAVDQALFDAVDAEQQRIAQLLHDTASQTLNAARIYARIARDAVNRICAEAAPPVLELEQVIQNAASELQLLTRWLRPVELGGSRLSVCLQDLAELAAGSAPCQLRCDGAAIDADEGSQAALLRIAQLALHALLLQRVEALELELTADERELVLHIQAASARALPEDFATPLDDRARLLGGSCKLERTAGSSTITCRLPRRRRALD